MATAPFRSIGAPLPILLIPGACPLPSVRNITSGWISLVESLRKTESEHKKKWKKLIAADFTWMKKAPHKWRKVQYNLCSKHQKCVRWTHCVRVSLRTWTIQHVRRSDRVKQNLWSVWVFFVPPTFEFLTRWGSDMSAVRYSMTMNESPSSNIWSSQYRTIYVISMKTTLQQKTVGMRSHIFHPLLSTSRQMKNFFKEFTCTGTYGFKQRKKHYKYRFRWNRQAIARMWNAWNFYGQSLVELRWYLICGQKECRACRAREVRNQRVIECSILEQ